MPGPLRNEEKARATAESHGGFAGECPEETHRSFQAVEGYCLTMLPEASPTESAANHDERLCNCGKISTAVVQEYISAHRERSIERVSQATGAGQGCGSCRVVIARLIEEELGVPADWSS